MAWTRSFETRGYPTDSRRQLKKADSRRQAQEGRLKKADSRRQAQEGRLKKAGSRRYEMTVVEKVTPAMFDDVYPLLSELDSSYSREKWREIFDYQWESDEGYVGLCVS